MDTFNYDAHDLQDNQQGFISHRQKYGLRWYLFRTTIWITAGGFMAGLWVFLFALLFSHAWTDADSGIWYKVFFTGGFFFALAMLIMAVHALFEVWRSVLYDLRVGNVEQLSGTLTKHRHRSKGSGLSLWIVIQNTRFDIGYGQHEALTDNKPYHLYLAEKTRRILAIETAPMSYQDKVKHGEKAKNDGG